jgi:hypothetical protein
MGKRNKRARTILRKASILGEEISPEVARRYGIDSLLPQKTNSQKIEELKTKNPEPITEEPKFMTEADTVKVEKKEAPKAEVKKTTRKRATRKTTTRTRKTKSKSISSEK